jgi:hypothetical protein
MVLMGIAGTLRGYPRVVHLLCQALARVSIRLECAGGRGEAIEAYALLGSRLGQREPAEEFAGEVGSQVQTPLVDEQRSTYPLPAPGQPPLVWTQPLRSAPEQPAHAPGSQASPRQVEPAPEADPPQLDPPELAGPPSPADGKETEGGEQIEGAGEEPDAGEAPGQTSRTDRLWAQAMRALGSPADVATYSDEALERDLEQVGPAQDPVLGTVHAILEAARVLRRQLTPGKPPGDGRGSAYGAALDAAVQALAGAPALGLADVRRAEWERALVHYWARWYAAHGAVYGAAQDAAPGLRFWERRRAERMQQFLRDDLSLRRQLADRGLRSVSLPERAGLEKLERELSRYRRTQWLTYALPIVGVLLSVVLGILAIGR